MDVAGLLILLAAGWVVGVVALGLYTAWMLTHPPRRAGAYAVARNLPSTPGEVRVAVDGREVALEYSEWMLDLDAADGGGALPVWDIVGLNRGGPTIIVTHGWGDSRVVMLGRAAALVRCAGRVVLWDLPRHGDAGVGESSSSKRARFSLGLHEHRALVALVERVRAGSDAPIVLYGYSLGAGVSIVAGCEAEHAGRGVAGVIAEAAYRVPRTPAHRVLVQAGLPHRLNLPMAMLVVGARLGQGAAWLEHEGAGGFDRREYAGRLRAPLLILHGDRDAICPIEDGLEMARVRRGASGTGEVEGLVTRMVEVAGGGHVDLWANADNASVCEGAVAEFVGLLTT